MINEHSPAHPYVNYICKSYEDQDNQYGLSKLEFAAIAMAQGSLANTGIPENETAFAEYCVRLAKVVLEKASDI